MNTRIVSWLWVLVWLCTSQALGDTEPKRVYHAVAPARMATAKHTHVCVRGIVSLLNWSEADGDIHVRITDTLKSFVVGEVVPSLTPSPRRPLREDWRVGDDIEICGIRRFDDEWQHGWWEVHPIESWRVIKHQTTRWTR